MSGFQNASITKGLMMVVGVSSLVVSLLDIKPYFHLQIVPHMTKYHQFWRILVHPLVFANSTELLIGELVLYQVGVTIERSFGPRKFSAFILVSSVVSTLLSFIGIILLSPFDVNAIPAGPYGIIFSLLWQHYRTVPSFYSFKVFGIEFSSKIFAWILALQLFLSHLPLSVLASTSGLFAGYLYRTDALLLPSIRHRRLVRPLKSFRIPASIYNLLARLFAPFDTSSAPRRSQRVLPGQISEATQRAVASRATLSTLLRMNNGPEPPAPSRLTLAPDLAALARARQTARDTSTPGTAPSAGAGEGEATVVGSTTGGRARAARAAMGEFVSEMAGRGTRAPTEEEIATLTSMFPNLSREVVVNTLQRHDNNTAQAVEALLQENI